MFLKGAGVVRRSASEKKTRPNLTLIRSPRSRARNNNQTQPSLMGEKCPERGDGGGKSGNEWDKRFHLD